MFSIHSNFTSLKLATGTQGAKDYWDFVMATMERTPLCQLNIGMDMPDIVGGYYTRLDGGLLDSINLPEHVATVDGNMVSFGTDEDFVVFMHESSHFMHLVVDKGMAIAPSLDCRIYSMVDDATDEEARRDIEYEAGYRSLFRNNVHHVFDDPRIIVDINLINLFTYDKSNLSGEQWIKLLSIYNDLETDEKKDWVKKHIIGNVQNYTDWADPKHEITWTE